MSNEDEIPPIWVSEIALKLARQNGSDTFHVRPMRGLVDIEYVPASALAEVWDKAIAIAKRWGTSQTIVAALEAARDAALSATAKENEGDELAR